MQYIVNHMGLSPVDFGAIVMKYGDAVTVKDGIVYYNNGKIIGTPSIVYPDLWEVLPPMLDVYRRMIENREAANKETPKPDPFHVVTCKEDVVSFQARVLSYKQAELERNQRKSLIHDNLQTLYWGIKELVMHAFWPTAYDSREETELPYVKIDDDYTVRLVPYAGEEQGLRLAVWYRDVEIR